MCFFVFSIGSGEKNENAVFSIFLLNLSPPANLSLHPLPLHTTPFASRVLGAIKACSRIRLSSHRSRNRCSPASSTGLTWKIKAKRQFSIRGTANGTGRGDS